MFLEIGERLEPSALELADPAFGDAVDRHGVQIVQLLAAALFRGDEVRRLENVEMLRHRLSRHGKPRAEFVERLSVTGTKAIQEPPPAAIGKSAEHRIHAHEQICNQTVAFCKPDFLSDAAARTVFFCCLAAAARHTLALRRRGGTAPWLRSSSSIPTRCHAGASCA